MGKKITENRQSHGSSVFKVEPIRNPADIMAIKKKLQESPRDLVLFIFGINTWLPISYLLRIRMVDIVNVNPGDKITIKSQRPGQSEVMFINKTMHCTLQQYIAHLKEDGKDCTEGYMFRSRKGGQPLTISTITNMVKHWTKIVGMSGNYGAQSLRKTCGFHRWIDPGANHKSISKYFKHSAISVTKRYLCIKDDDGAKEKFTELGADPEQSDSTSQKPINPMISVNETGTIIYNNQWFKTESVKNYKLSGDLDYMSTVKMITKNISVMIRITDLTGKNKYVSPSHYKIMGYKPEDRLSKSCFDICHPDDIDTLLNALNVLADKLYTGDFYSNNMMPLYRARHAGGHYMWLQTVLDLIQDSQGKIRDVLHSSRVFTDHKVAEEFLAARQPANQYRPSYLLLTT